MAAEATPLTDDERAELERLRAEKAAREQAERDRQERAELERLRAERNAARQAPAARPSAEDGRVRAARERGRRLMEPDDDLSMPLGQKIVLAVVALAVLAVVAMFVFGPH